MRAGHCNSRGSLELRIFSGGLGFSITTLKPKPATLLMNEKLTNALLAEHLRRKELDPLGEYMPHEKQLQFHQSQAHKTLYIAGNRSGKSYAGAHEVAMAVTGRHFVEGKYPIPNRGRIGGERTTLEGEIIPLLHKLHDRYLASAPRRNSVGMEYQWKFKNGSMFDILTYSQDDKQWAGVQLDWFWGDEPFRESIYNETISRMSSGRGGHMFFTLTPLFHAAWMFERLIRGVEEEGKISKNGVLVVTASIWDNCIDNGGYLEREAIQRMVDEYDEEMIDARVNGKFAVMRDVVFPRYDPAVHVLDPEVTPQQVRDEEMQIYVVLDPHKVRPPAWALFAIDKNDVRYTLDEWPNYFNGHYRGQYYSNLKNSRFTFTDLVKIWAEIEEYWGGNIRRRYIDPRYGKALQDNSRRTTMEEFSHVAKELDIDMKFIQAVVGKDMGTGEIDSGLHLINQALSFTPDSPHRPMWYDNVRCANTIRAQQFLRVNRREGKEAEGRSPSEELLDEFKDFADLKRYFIKSVTGYRHMIHKRSEYVYTPASSLTGY